jgi:hypothetical protein
MPVKPIIQSRTRYYSSRSSNTWHYEYSLISHVYCDHLIILGWQIDTFTAQACRLLVLWRFIVWIGKVEVKSTNTERVWQMNERKSLRVVWEIVTNVSEDSTAANFRTGSWNAHNDRVTFQKAVILIHPYSKTSNSEGLIQSDELLLSSLCLF